MSPLDTARTESLLHAAGASPTVAHIVALPFAQRDLELIDFLKGRNDLPAGEEFPSAQVVAQTLDIELRWAAFTLEKIHRFLHKRRINGDFTADIWSFSAHPDVVTLAPACRNLRKGTTFFIGDSLMDIRHFSANASFPILAGSFLQSLGAGPYVNAGIGGQTTKQGLARFDKDVLTHKPARVVFSFGSNDLANGVPIDTICHNFDAMIGPAQTQGAQIVLGLILPIITERLWWSSSPMRNATLEARRPLQAAMLDLARRHNIPCLDLLDRLTADHYCVDGVHINQSGQEICAVETLRLLTQ
jgi:lysophospholipase L1-like esterase